MKRELLSLKNSSSRKKEYENELKHFLKEGKKDCRCNGLYCLSTMSTMIGIQSMALTHV